MQCFLAEQELRLLPQKAVFLPRQSLLAVADLHLGKAGHFRKAGIAVPEAVHQADLDCLAQLLASTQARHLLFLGDLYHSAPNQGWLDFAQWLQGWLGGSPGREATLVLGNHDRPAGGFMPQGLRLAPQCALGPLLLTHEPLPLEQLGPGQYNLCGHLHPSVRIAGKGRQSLQLPCFCFGPRQGFLPAFGQFNGKMPLRPAAHDQIFLIADETVVPWRHG